MRTIDIDDDGVETTFGGGDITAAVIDDELSCGWLAQELFFGDAADGGVYIDIGVAIARFVLGKREATGAENEDVAPAEL